MDKSRPITINDIQIFLGFIVVIASVVYWGATVSAKVDEIVSQHKEFREVVKSLSDDVIVLKSHDSYYSSEFKSADNSATLR